MKKRNQIGALALTAMLALQPVVPARAYKADTLRSGMRGDAVKQMQLALISLGYLGGTADGIFGTNTENAVKKFQRASSLKADGLAGTQTLEKLYKKAGQSSGSSSSSTSSTSSASASSSGSGGSSSSSSSSQSSAASSSGSSLFGGNYATLRQGSTGSRVTTLQQRLISLGYLSGAADGKYGRMTAQAVKAFQRASGLTADGLAGKMTLQALEKKGSSSSGTSSSSSASTATSTSTSSTSSSGTPSSGTTASGPNGAAVKLLHWFNDIKPTLRSGQTLLIYEPSSGQSWNLRIYSSGRHCDAEPATAEDTASMLKAFKGENTWSQKAVYVKLPSGTWTIGATHSMPHLSGSVKDNNFNGHLCVHFLRTMSEAEENDPKYGVSNQQTIRSFWKRLTGETISY